MFTERGTRSAIRGTGTFPFTQINPGFFHTPYIHTYIHTPQTGHKPIAELTLDESEPALIRFQRDCPLVQPLDFMLIRNSVLSQLLTFAGRSQKTCLQLGQAYIKTQ